MKKYSEEIQAFIAANVKGRTCKELSALVNQKFKTNFTESSMKSYKTNHKLKSNIKRGNQLGESKLFPAEIREFIKANVKGKYNVELTELVNNKFRTNYTVGQIGSYKTNNRISSDLTGHFKTGHIPDNKGKKMPKEVYEKCKKTMFKKGNTPQNHRSVGSERFTKDGYTEIKTAEPNIWQLKQVFLWEQYNGSAPKGHKIIFLDGNKENIVIENLALISDAELCELNCRLKVKSEYPEITKAGIAVAKVKCAIRNKKNIKRGKNNNANKRYSEKSKIYN